MSGGYSYGAGSESESEDEDEEDDDDDEENGAHSEWRTQFIVINNYDIQNK